MAKNILTFKTKGMNRDMSVSAFSSEYSFENMNLRLSTNEGNTQMSWVNEKGTKKLNYNVDTRSWTGLGTDEDGLRHDVIGIPIGTAVIDHRMVVFTTTTGTSLEETKPDYIYVFEAPKDDVLEGKLLFRGKLNFDPNYPLETLVSYESELVQKVYWTDNLNQPRLINIAAEDSRIEQWNKVAEGELCTFFDFAPDINFDVTVDGVTGPVVEVQKMVGANGNFAAGVIQYAFTYYNKYGQESCIFHVTPLYYISYLDRGAAADVNLSNAFKITVKGVDKNFDYLRIYSIHRTSLNDTPITKRVQDILLKDCTNNTVTFTDTGTTGDSITPTELLYKNSEVITAKTMEQKDNTLFLGNITVARPYISDSIKSLLQKNYSIVPREKTIKLSSYSDYKYAYTNQLTCFKDDDHTISTPCSGFKTGDIYRLGVQFQYKNGKWSDPVWMTDTFNSYRPYEEGGNIHLPVFQALISSDVVTSLIDAGYKRARPLVVFPNIQDRRTICQGVVCPTVYTNQHHKDNDLYAQSSWFFRTTPPLGKDNRSISITGHEGAAIPVNSGILPYTSNSSTYYTYPTTGSSIDIRQVEIDGVYDDDHSFRISNDMFTIHTPDLEFEESMQTIDYTDLYMQVAGWQSVKRTFSDIDIQTESPTIANSGGGFIHKAFTKSATTSATTTDDGNFGIISGLFYDDYIVEDDGDTLQKFDKEKNSVKWMVYLWNKTGSLNNDINRPSDKGTVTAELKKKVISNLRYCVLDVWDNIDWTALNLTKTTLQLFNSDEATIIKCNDNIYMGNIDTLLVPTYQGGQFFAANGINTDRYGVVDFTSDVLWKTYASNEDGDNCGLWTFQDGSWIQVKDSAIRNWDFDTIGNKYLDLVLKKGNVRMKYKTTPHLVYNGTFTSSDLRQNRLPIVEVMRDLVTDMDADNYTLFGGTSQDAFKENNWVPCGDPVYMKEGESCTIEYSYGDTYYQRWDCLKTYPFTTDDPNQVVEIGSFMLETRVNIDGRYDRNRGQVSNINMSPRNFNLYNPVYSQIDNFFTYKMLDEDDYKNNSYPNQLTWTLTKNSNADVDLWTNITLANTLELDGDKGQLTKLIRMDDQLLAFQDTGISQILYNENTQISTTEGVPIEIANSGKVQGKRYLSSTIGCSNKWSVVSAPTGIYFMDNFDRSIYIYNGGGLQNVAATKGFDAWAKLNIPNPKDNEWTPIDYNNFVGYYDKVNQDILFINKDKALAYSEKFGAFTSFYDYGDVPYLVNLDNTGLWITKNDAECTIWEHNKGDYSNFFGTPKPYWMTLVGNPEPQKSKVFTNLELRVSVDGDGINTVKKDDEGKVISETFNPYLPFDYLETWDEYQHGYTELGNLKGIAALRHYEDDNSSLKRKFRIWRCDIPRDNAVIDTDRKDGTTYNYSTDAELNVSRTKARPFDRMRNPWIYLKLQKQAKGTMSRAEVHDVIMTYFS